MIDVREYPNRFVTLDGLRGVAALGVVFYHIPNTSNGPAFVPHGHIAVDFFFILSGFVLAFSYEERLRTGRLTSKDVIVRRIVRLWPMLLAGLALGVCSYVIQGTVATSALSALLKCVGFGLFALPVLGSNPFRDNIAPLNGPAWSLFFETYVGTAALLLAPRMSSRFLLLATALAWATFLYLIARFGYNVGSWPGAFFPGFARFLATFLSGILLWRVLPRIHAPNVHPLVPASLLIVSLCLPFGGSRVHWIEAGVVLFCFPALIWLGAACQPGGRMTGWLEFLGRLSYPLYIVHFPIMQISAHLFPGALGICVGIVLAVLCAVALMIYYDDPVRRALGNMR